MTGSLQAVLSFTKGMGWRGKVLAALGFMLTTEAVYELYLLVQKKIAQRKSEKPFCEVRFMNRQNVSNGVKNVSDMQYGNITYLISYIDRAQVSICVSMYILTLKDVRDALIRAKKERNVTVRVVCCESMVYNEGSQMRHLQDADCFVNFKIGSGYLMHHKFCLLDIEWLCGTCLVKEHLELVGKAPREMMFTMFDRAVSDNLEGLVKHFGSSCVRCDSSKRESRPSSVKNPFPKGGCLITGSSNWTYPALCTHWDNMVFTSIPQMVRPFAVEFQRQWYEFSDS